MEVSKAPRQPLKSGKAFNFLRISSDASGLRYRGGTHVQTLVQLGLKVIILIVTYQNPDLSQPKLLQDTFLFASICFRSFVAYFCFYQNFANTSLHCQFPQQVCTNFMQTYLYSLISTRFFILTTNLH